MRTVQRIPLLSLMLVAVVALVVAGCGSKKSSSSPSSSSSSTDTSTQSTTPSSTSSAASSSAGGGQVVKLSADPSGALKFTTTTLHAKAGKVTLEMMNPSSVPHNIAVEGNGVDKDSPTVANQGQTSQVSVTLKKGTYEFYCPVDGHKAAGMKGTLIVS